ncbi:hypothetical protein [Streptomyces viridochromogenes]|uniref:Putative Exopolysaccharide inner membrane protein n=1 Tax=Streptomyces viridochromogenes Tue57 TaxID=1160705 RepID=L8PLY5_STRVR|nr:hypothetical protein [Streptomyces viridochromogenes]ELS57520.1 putative Exopolysaccharide inner membrane protein [Streptomyces viridochromogenes Tue57]
MNDTESPGPSRHTLLQAADATAAAYSLVGAAAGTARATEATSSGAPEVTSPERATTTKNQVFNHLITESELPTSFAAEALPKDLAVDTATGLTSGTAEDDVGSFTVTVSATNSVGTATQSRTLTVQHA